MCRFISLHLALTRQMQALKWGQRQHAALADHLVSGILESRDMVWLTGGLLHSVDSTTNR